jgi:hypothetical protein
MSLGQKGGSVAMSAGGGQGRTSRVALLVIDEASRVDDALYASVRPMLAVSEGRIIALSTPFGRRGWFHAAWESRVYRLMPMLPNASLSGRLTRSDAEAHHLMMVLARRG